MKKIAGVLAACALLLAACGTTTGPAAKTETVTVTITEKPAAPTSSDACRDAVAKARKVMKLSGESMGQMSTVLKLVPEVMDAVQNADSATLEDIAGQVRDATAVLNANTDKITNSGFSDAAAKCEAG